MRAPERFYEFSSDYPNLRHGGRQANQRQIRALKKDDAILALSFAILLVSFIADNNAGQAILSGDF
jgi:hypothetical protein